MTKGPTKAIQPIANAPADFVVNKEKMKTIATAKDKNGKPVKTGDIVRVIAINYEAIKDLAINEQNKLK